MNSYGSKLRQCVMCALSLAVVAACSESEPPEGEDVAAAKATLNTAPVIADFVVYAQNSATLMDRVVVTGADVGVKGVSAGPTLVTGFELALSSDVRVDVTQDVMANRLRLLDRATVGDVEANQLTNHNGNISHLHPLPATMPALPPVATVTAGTTNVTVATAQTTVLNAGNYAAVVVQGTLRLKGGSYQLASLQLANDAKVEALAPAQLHIAGRLSLLDRDRIGAAAGVSLAAGDVQIEVAGRNGASGSLTDSPKAVSLGNSDVLSALILAPNGTLQVGQRATLVGAFAARDVFIDVDSQVTFQSGFAVLICSPSNCDDSNLCTTDTCSSGTCLHAPLAASVINDGNPCTADSCLPASGVVHTLLAAGASCADGNACNGAETCSAAGTCLAGVPPTVDDGNPCTADSCLPASGVVHTPLVAGASCSDGNACNGAETCNGAGVCTAGVAPTVDDGNPCTADLCSPAGGLVHTPLAAGTSCASSNTCVGAGACDGAGACAVTSVPADGTACSADACSSGGICQGGACVGAGARACPNPTDVCVLPSGCVTSCDPGGCVVLGTGAGNPKLAIPSGALRATVPIRITDIGGKEVEVGDPDAASVFRVYELDPSGTQFAVPATIDLPAPPLLPGQGAVIEVNSVNAFSPTNRWVPIATTLSGGRLSGSIAHFSYSRTVVATNCGPAGCQVPGTGQFDSTDATDPSLTIPPGALSSTVPIGVTFIGEGGSVDVEFPNTWPPGFDEAKDLTVFDRYQLSPSGTQFAVPATISLPAPAPLNGHTTIIEVNTTDAPDIVGVDTGWVAVPTTYTPLPNVDQTDVFIAVGGHVSGPIAHFSYCRTRDIAPTLTPGIVVTDMWQNTPDLPSQFNCDPTAAAGAATNSISLCVQVSNPTATSIANAHATINLWACGQPARGTGANAALEAFDFTDGSGAFEGVHCDSTGDSTDFIQPCDPVDVNVPFPLGFLDPGATATINFRVGDASSLPNASDVAAGFCVGTGFYGVDFTFREPTQADTGAGIRSAKDGPFVGVQGTAFQGIYPTMKPATDPEGNSYTIKNFLAPIGQE